MIRNYKEIEEYILSIPKFTKKNSLEATRAFYEYLGKPGSSSLTIHVAGTNGKGSVCAYMNAVFEEAGKTVGMFTSPHLVDMRERIRINSQLITECKFCQIFEKLMNQIQTYKEETKKEDYHPTFFEFLFFIAMLYFGEKKTEIILLETGLGGRLDATNAIDAPKVAVITEIGLDHTEYLGNTLEEIAAEKAGIIKKGSCVVYSGKRQQTSEVIERKCKEQDVLCKCVEKLEKQAYRFVDKKIDFSFFSRYYDYIPIRLNTSAVYQVENAALALTALEETGITISKETIQRGMAKCKWAGRMEEILPQVFLDGAHNADGIDAFLNSVKEDGCVGQRWLLFSAVADKEYQIMKDKLVTSGLFHHIYAAPLKNTRGLLKSELEHIFNGQEAQILDCACEGLREILSVRSEQDFIYAAGSLYLVGELKEQFCLK